MVLAIVIGVCRFCLLAIYYCLNHLLKLEQEYQCLFILVFQFFSAILSFVFLHESMTFRQIIGMIITITGIAMVILVGDKEKNKIKLSHPVLGILLAFGGAIGQSIGYIIGKYGMDQYDAFAATQIRMIAGIVGFAIFFTFTKQWKSFFNSLKQKDAIKPTIIGAFFGPFIGVSLSLYAVQRINPGVASTLMAITPVLLMLYAMVFKGEKVKIKEILGSIVSVGGLAIIFI